MGLDELKDLFFNMLDDLKKKEPKLYKELSLEVYEHIYGNKITKECAEVIVKYMKPYGEKWKYETVQNYNKGYDHVEFYLVMNMFYNGYNKIIGNDENTYAKFADAWFTDIDGKENKTFDYFMK